jgi:hypothetical protein
MSIFWSYAKGFHHGFICIKVIFHPIPFMQNAFRPFNISVVTDLAQSMTDLMVNTCATIDNLL